MVKVLDIMLCCAIAIYADTLSISYTPQKTIVETVFVDKKSPCAYGSEEILAFADELFRLGDYSRAAIEYLRYSFLYPDEKCAKQSLFRAGLCKEYSKKYDEARIIYAQLALSADPYTMQFPKYRIPLTFFMQNSLDSAFESIDTINAGECYGALQYLRGWIFLRKREYNSALSIFQHISANASNSSISGSLDYLILRCKTTKDLSYRSPFFAGLLSTFIPGMGRGYCGRWGDAFFSFAVVGIASGLAAYMWKDDPAFSYTMAGIGSFFYIGNIYGSVKGAKVYNEEVGEKFWKKTWSEVPHPPTMLYSEMPCERQTE